MGSLRRTAVQSNFRVQVSKDYLVFASAHFITFRGHQCETLHGHNYRVGVAVEGAVDSECLFVLDFSVLKQITRSWSTPSIIRFSCPRSIPSSPSARRAIGSRSITSASRPMCSHDATAP